MNNKTPQPEEECPWCNSEATFVYRKEGLRKYACGSYLYSNTGSKERSSLCVALERGNKAEAELKEVKRELAMWERGVYYKPKMQAVIDALKARNIMLKDLLERALDVAPMYWTDGQKQEKVEEEYKGLK